LPYQRQIYGKFSGIHTKKQLNAAVIAKKIEVAIHVNFKSIGYFFEEV